jgi:hypothetical protein
MESLNQRKRNVGPRKKMKEKIKKISCVLQGKNKHNWMISDLEREKSLG